MDVARIFYILKENDKITKNELYDCGATDEYIQSAIDNNILISIGNGEYKIGNAEELIYYGRYLLEVKDFKGANSVFNCAYINDHDNFVVNYQLFYRALGQKKRGRIFRHFDVLYEKLIEDGRGFDANYYLFLLGNLYSLDEKYGEKFINIELDDILIPSDDDFSKYENLLRKKVYTNSYHSVTTMLDERFDYEDRNQIPFEDMVEKELLLQWLVRKREFNKNIATSLEKGYMEYVKNLLDTEDNKRNLTTTNEYVLKIVNSYLTIQNTGVILVPKYYGDNVFDAINGNNYKLALELEEKRINELKIGRTTNLYLALEKIVSLIEISMKIATDKPIVAEEKEVVVNNDQITLDDSLKQSIDDKVSKLHNGRMVFLLEPMPQAMRDAIREYLKYKGYSDIFAFSIGIGDERRVALRYKPIIKEYVDLKATLDDARAFYASQDYELAAECYELSMKIGRPKESTYGGYGMTLYRMGRREEALDCLKVATIMSKTEGNGKIDFTELIERIENPVERENRKPRVVVKESEFEDKNESSLDDGLINDLIGLFNEGEISLIDACKSLGLSEEDINYVKLLYARDCYYLGNDKDGDLYFKQVEKSKAKNKRVKELYKDIQINKKYYRNRFDSSKNQLVFIKK